MPKKKPASDWQLSHKSLGKSEKIFLAACLVVPGALVVLAGYGFYKLVSRVVG